MAPATGHDALQGVPPLEGGCYTDLGDDPAISVAAHDSINGVAVALVAALRAAVVMDEPRRGDGCEAWCSRPRWRSITCATGHHAHTTPLARHG